MEKKRRRKKGKTGPEPEERDERVKNTGRRDEKEVRMGAGGDEGEDCSGAARLAAVCFVVVAQLPHCGWVLLFLQCGCNVYFQLRERMQPSQLSKLNCLPPSLPPSLSLFSLLQHHFFSSL